MPSQVPLYSLSRPSQHPVIALVGSDGNPENLSSYIPSVAAAPSPVYALRKRLVNGEESFAITALGDSTANQTTEWIYLALRDFMAGYPAYSVAYRLWNDTDQAYDDAVGVQVGTAGDAFVTLPGTAGSYVSTPDSAAVSVVGDLDVRVKVAATDWTQAAVFQGLAAKFGAAGQRSWRFQLTAPGGQLYYEWSADGSALNGKTSTAAPTVADGAALWVRATHDVDNGASGNDVKFYTAPDVNGAAGAWTQLGATVTTAGVTSIFDSTSILELGGRGTGTTEMLTGKVYAFELRSGLDGAIVAAFDAGNWTRLGTTVPGLCGEVWSLLSTAAITGAPQVTILNGSVAGATLAYSNDGVRFPRLTPIESAITIINYGHNDSASGTLTTDYKTLADAIMAKWPVCGIVAAIQNPQIAPRTATQISNQSRAAGRILALASAQGWNVVNAFAAITDAGSGATYISGDGIHPTQAGSDLWADTALTTLQSG